MKGLYSKRVHQEEAPAGVTFYTVDSTLTGGVYLRGSFLGGANFAPKRNPLIAECMVSLLDEGTKRYAKDALQEEIDAIGAECYFSCGGDRIYYSLKVIREHLPRALELLREMIFAPRFGRREMEAVRRQHLGDITRLLTDTGARSKEALLLSLYPQQHPNAPVRLEEQLAYVKKLSRADLETYHRRVLGRSHSIHVAGGDIGIAQKKVIAAFLHDLPERTPQRERTPRYTSAKRVEKICSIPDKTSVDFYVGGKTGMRSTDTAYDALRLVLLILTGSLTEGDRLLGIVRGKYGLTQ